MNLKSKTHMTALTVFCLLAVASGPLWAQQPHGGGVPLELTISAVARVQGVTTDNGTVIKTPIGTIPITTKWMLQQIAINAAISTLPRDAKLILGTNNVVSVTDSLGNVLLNASPYVSVHLDSDSNGGVWQGQSRVDNADGFVNYNGTYISAITLAVDQSGNTVTLTGPTKELYTLSSLNAFGHQTGTDAIYLTGAGYGKIQTSHGTTNQIFVTGTVTGRGKGPLQ